jgi:uncharacterized oligopeptide transporter (OPT) family protein
VLLVACTVGVDMQQDRSTGWRLGSDRRMQFRYQAVGILMGAALCVAFAQLFMTAYPVLRIDTYTHPEARVGGWQSAMTFKFVGALRGLGHLKHHQVLALEIGFGVGLVIQILRKGLLARPAWRAFTAKAGAGFAIGWLVDAIFISSPYAASFGGFVDLSTSAWMTVGGVIASLLATIEARRHRVRGHAVANPSTEQRGELDEAPSAADALPEDMSTNSLLGGGLIAGESLYTLFAAIASLLSMLR